MPSSTQRQALLAQLPTYHSPAWLRGSHAQTIAAKAVREPLPAYRRRLEQDSTGLSQVAYDWIDSDNAAAPVVVLFHGLEGSSESHYARALMNQLSARGWLGCVPHFRGCGGVPNTAPIYYHCGDSTEIAHMLAVVHRNAPARSILAVGVSLGGNALAKYLAESGDKALCQMAVVVSAPLDLLRASVCLDHGLSRRLYNPYFLHTLLPKVKREAQTYRNIDLANVLASHTLGDFDNRFTAPVHGFRDRYDYYRRAAAKPLLHDIAVPTLILNARNDPFMPAAALPTENDVSDHVYLLQPEHGGHVGFVSQAHGLNLRWLPETILRFFDLNAKSA